MRTSSVLCGGMVVLLNLVCSVFARTKAGRPQRTQFKIRFKNAKKGSTAKPETGQKSADSGCERRKKTARLAGGFSGILGVLRALTPLSIRQRSEMPEKIKVKPGGGHDEKKVAHRKRLTGFITRSGSGDKLGHPKMRIIRTFLAKIARNVRDHSIRPFRRPSSGRCAASAGRRRPARSGLPCRRRRRRYPAPCRCRSC